MTSDRTELTPATELAAKNAARHPNESDEYRRARQELLVEEIELRRHVERVASLRRDLPSSGEVPREYRFVAEDGKEVTLSDLFGQHDTLVVYSYMFGPQREAPCPMCTSLMGGFDHKIGGDMADPGQDPRGAVEMDPLWLVLDTTPGGRDGDWHPQLTY